MGIRSTSAIGLLVAISGCAPMGSPMTPEMLKLSLANGACTSYSTFAFDPLISSLQQGYALPSPAVYKAELKTELEKNQTTKAWSSESKNQLIDKMLKVYAPLYQAAIAQSDTNKMIETLSAIETNDPRPTLMAAKDQLVTSAAELRITAQGLGLNCEAGSAAPKPNSELFNAIKQLAHPAVYGAHKVTATAYQSCQTLDQEPMTADTPAVSGIEIIGTHPDGVGQQRVVASVDAVSTTHYYIADINKAQATCQDLHQEPLIYDYGGKPYASAGAAGTLDVFRDAGTGTTALGIDCSGYVFSSFAAAGLKMSPTEPLKAQNVYGINSARFKTAPESGLTCFEYAKVDNQKSLQPGDVVASDGHVFLVDWIGDDPLGIKNITTRADCRIGPVSASKFDFVLSQSSPIKNGIGINRIHAKDYLTSGEMKSGLEQFAVQACLRRFDGGSESPALSKIGIVRHKRTPECIATEVYLEKQDCLNVCRL